MSLMQRLTARSRIRSCRRELAESPSARNYLALAGEHARLGELGQAARVCQEGLEAFPGNPELERLAARARQLSLEDRTRELSRELREAPRPALYRELSGLFLDAGRVERAEECAAEWFQATGDGQAQLLRAQARLSRFLADRRREDGRMACELCDSAEGLLPGDERPLALRLELATRVGAWQEARRMVCRLLELRPGDPELEARFRHLGTLEPGAPTMEQALREVEKTGRLVDEREAQPGASPAGSAIRPLLQALKSQPGVQSAVYVRGATALVQGAKGATAERQARAVREVIHKSRTAARRLGIGQTYEVQLEGDFGTLVAAAGDPALAACWCAGAPGERQRDLLTELVGAAPEGGGEERG